MENKILVAVFSASGVTKKVGEETARIIGGDFFEIRPKEPYTSNDLSWMNKKSRSSLEMNDPSVRPEIAGTVSDMDSYDIVIIGYPIWWGVAPRIMETFLESYDFSGKTILPFCTSGGSGAGRTGETLGEQAGTGTFLSSTRFSSGVSDAELQRWIDSHS